MPTLGLSPVEAHDLHLALQTTVTLLRAVEIPPDASLTAESEARLMAVARRLDHNIRHAPATPVHNCGRCRPACPGAPR